MVILSIEIHHKRCTSCNKTKPKGCFYYRSDKEHLLQSHCKDCIKLKRKNYRLNNIKKFKTRDKAYHHRNRAERLNYLKMWQANNRNKINYHYREKYKQDIEFHIRQTISNRIRMALKRNSKCTSTITLLGCTIS